MIRHGTAIPIGAGATSHVYKCWDDARSEWVAIKYLNQPDPVALARLLREARAVSGLRHPHLCPILEVGESEGRHYILMPFLDGRSFGEAISELPIEARLRLLIQIADAVHAAHEHGILHRDLKPDNLLVTEVDGLPHAWVLDFGLVREIGGPGLTETGQVLGTPAYMSPEQARGETTLDRRSDVFALGAVLYFAIAGHPPFAANSTAETLLKVIREDAPRLRRFRRDTPAALEAIVSAALQKNPSRRYDSAHAFAADLRRHLKGERPLARISRGDSLRRIARSHPFAFGLGLAALLALIAATAVGLHMDSSARERARRAAQTAAETEAARQSLRIEFLRARHDIEPALAPALATIDRLARSDADDPLLRQRALRAAAELRIELGDVEAAVPLLRQAAALVDDPATTRALGLAEARAYRAAMSAPQPYADPVLRDRWRAQARSDYLEPARLALAAPAAGLPDAQARAEIAFAEGHDDDALAMLEATVGNAANGYEAMLAAAEIRMLRGIERQWSNAGEAARAEYDGAANLLAAALEEGRSDPRLHRRNCELASLRVAALAEGLYPAEALGDADQACRRALEVRPGEARLHATRAHLLATRAKQMRSLAGDADALLSEAVQHAERAYVLAPKDPQVAQELALALMRQSTQRRWAGHTEKASIERAATVLDAVAESADERVDPLLIAGQVQGERAQVLERLGEDPGDAYLAAIAKMQTAVERAPEAPFLRLNLAGALSNLAWVRAARGRPDITLIERSIAELRKVIEAQPRRASAWLSLANSHWDLAMARGWRGDAAAAANAIAQADTLFEKAGELAPENLSVPFNRFGFELFVVAELLRSGGDAQARLERALSLIRRIDAKTDTDWITPCPRADYYLRRVQAQAAAGRLDETARRRAVALLEQGLAAQADDIDCARRRIELAAYSLPLLAQGERARELQLAAQLRGRHADALEIDLAWARVLAARPEIDSDAAVASALDGLLRHIEEVTAGAWQARLKPLRERLGRVE